MTEPLTIDLSDPEFWQDPYPTWQEARRRGRTALTQRGEPIVLEADDMDTLNTDSVFAQLGGPEPRSGVEKRHHLRALWHGGQRL